MIAYAVAKNAKKRTLMRDQLGDQPQESEDERNRAHESHQRSPQYSEHPQQSSSLAQRSPQRHLQESKKSERRQRDPNDNDETDYNYEDEIFEEAVEDEGSEQDGEGNYMQIVEEVNRKTITRKKMKVPQDKKDNK